ncbi:hypothetical protein ACLOJK_008054 [Asimina triloba]
MSTFDARDKPIYTKRSTHGPEDSGIETDTPNPPSAISIQHVSLKKEALDACSPPAPTSHSKSGHIIFKQS